MRYRELRNVSSVGWPSSTDSERHRPNTEPFKKSKQDSINTKIKKNENVVFVKIIYEVRESYLCVLSKKNTTF